MGRDDRYKDIQLAQLRGFCLAATEGNFTSAARALGVSAPTVWQQVRALERRLHTTLMRRRGRSVELTPEGKILLELVQPHVQGLDSIEAAFVVRQATSVRPLVVASIPYLGSEHLLAPVREFTTTHADVRLTLHIRVWFDEVVRMVEHGQADVGVIFYDREAPISPQLKYERLFDLHFGMLMPLDHPLVRKKALKVADLVAYPLILAPEGSFARRTFDRLLRKHGLADRAHLILETAMAETIRKYVAAGIGIAALHLADEAELPDTCFRRFPVPDEALAAGFVVRKGAHLSASAVEFVRLLKQHVRTNAKDEN